MDCPSGVDIPRVFAIYNHYKMVASSNPDIGGIVLKNTYRTLADSEQAHNCVACGQCLSHCPQAIEIPKNMKEIAYLVSGQ
jgi:predicted aldo/keto reductase-like oxidoreductase